MRLLHAFMISLNRTVDRIYCDARTGLALVCVISLLGMPAWAQNGKAQNGREGSVIKGSQEQPKVLYIVPWQLPTSPGLDVPPPQADVEGVLQPLERDFYRQSLYFRRHLKIGVLPDD